MFESISECNNRYKTPKEIAQALKIEKATLTRWVKMGCPCVYFGKATTSRRGARPRFNIDEVEAWLKERTKKGDAQ